MQTRKSVLTLYGEYMNCSRTSSLILLLMAASFGDPHAVLASCWNGMFEVLQKHEHADYYERLCVPYAALALAGHWKPGRGDPPLGLSSAIDTAVQFGRKSDAEAIAKGIIDDVRVESILLRPASCDDSKNAREDCYFYLIEMKAYLQAVHVDGLDSTLAVLMDRSTFSIETVSFAPD